MSEQPPINLGQSPPKPNPGFGTPSPPQKNNTLLIVGIIGGVVALIFLGCCGCCVISSIVSPSTDDVDDGGFDDGGFEVSTETKSSKSSVSSSRFKGITDAGYNEIQDGMSESTVEAILGKGSEVGSAGDFKTVSYEKGFKIITISYQNGRVAGKVKTF